MTRKSATAFAPATTGNVGVGFDTLGLALSAIGDTVTVTRTNKTGSIEISGLAGTGISANPEKNTATAGLLQMMHDLRLIFGFKVRIRKGIPLGSGMGGSAASAVAGVVAANALLDKPLSKHELLKYALIGESVATTDQGARAKNSSSKNIAHADNVAPCLFGGLVLVQSVLPPNIVSIPFPANLVIVIASPKLQVETKKARRILKPNVSLKDHVKQSANLAGFISGCFSKNVDLIAASFKDILIEPQRAHLIAGFRDVQKAACDAGASGCTISGAGPAVFAICRKNHAPTVKRAMIEAFNRAGAGPARGWISAVNTKGAYLL